MAQASEFHRRVRGCLLGGAIGDALGAPIEFDSLAEIRRRGPSYDGLVTDDTQMTLFTVEGLIRARTRAREKGIGGAEVALVKNAYLRWLDTQDFPAPPPPNALVRTGWLRGQTWLYARRAPGNACLSGLRGSVDPHSKGCGTVMRSAPFGLFLRDPRGAFRLSAECARLTHGHPTGALAAGALAALIAFLLTGRPLASALGDVLALLAEHRDHEETTDALRAAVALAATGDPTPEKVESLGGAWIAEEALAIGVYAALVHEHDVEAALTLSVIHSGDSDSTGSICGNILGVRHGDRALPRHWLDPLEGRATIDRLAADLCAAEVSWDDYPGF